MTDRLPKVQHSRQPQDTADWCAERAEADRVAAAATDIDNVRKRFELSAASWSARAEMLRRIEAGTDARTAAVRAEWDEEDVPLRAALRGAGAGEEASDVRL